MADVTIRRLDEFDSAFGGAMKLVRHGLGVEAFGLQVIDMPPNADQYPEHDHAGDGQEEVYLALRGSGEIEVGGERHALDPETMVRVGPGVKRKLYAGSDGIRVLALGAYPDKTYEAPDMSKLGEPDPLASQTA